jgi:signal transduction histidine kinase
MVDYRGTLLLTHSVEVTELVRARRDVEDALHLRDEFLSIASHELKTPVTALRGQAQLVMRRLERNTTVEPEQVNRALQSITAQAGKLTRLVGQLLDVSRLEAGKLGIELEWTDLVPLVQDAAARARTMSGDHGIDVHAPESCAAEVDPLRLEQVLTNVLDNAIKYSPEGGAIEVVLAHADHGTVQISVTDQGLGIPVEKREQIFERFYQAHGSGHRSGLGLGLYICRQIVELHGGSIHAEFPPRGGTRFIVRLPTRVPDAGQFPPAH